MCVERCVSVKIFTTIIQMQPSTQCAFWWYIKPDLVRPNGERKKIGEIFWKFENLKKSEKFENFGKNVKIWQKLSLFVSLIERKMHNFLVFCTFIILQKYIIAPFNLLILRSIKYFPK